MHKITDWLHERPLLNWGLAIGYFIFILFMHDPLVNLSVWLMNGLTLSVYEVVVISAVLLVLGTASFFFIRNLVRRREQVMGQVIVLLLILIALVAHRKVLLVLNIELIHFFQFGLFTLIVFPLTRKFSPTMLIVTIFAYLDELFQYQWLYPERENYFDFNDVITDQLGMAMALLFLWNAAVPRIALLPWKQWFRSPWLLLFAGLLLGIVVLMASSLVVTYAGHAAPHTWLLLNEAQAPMSFWEPFYDSGIYYHVLRPREGFPIHLLLLGLVLLWEIKIGRKPEPTSN